MSSFLYSFLVLYATIFLDIYALYVHVVIELAISSVVVPANFYTIVLQNSKLKIQRAKFCHKKIAIDEQLSHFCYAIALAPAVNT